MDSKLADGLIIKTTEVCIIKGVNYKGIPTIIWPEGIDRDVSDYLRSVVVEEGSATSSAVEYAKLLRPFLRYCRSEGRVWQSVDDDFIIRWRNLIRGGMKRSIGRTNASLNAIFAFYRWAERTNRIRLRVGIYTEDEIPDAMKGTAFPITAKRTLIRGAHGHSYEHWITPFTLRDRGKNSRLRHTPTEEQVRALHELTSIRNQGERNSLIFSWAEETGARRSEILQLRVSHLPTESEIERLVSQDEPWHISISRKRGNPKPLNPVPDMLIRTWDYVNFERREIVERCRSSIIGYREPDEIFLSSRTGMVLNPDSVTAMSRTLFQRAGIRKASLHRLRAKFAVNVIETLLDALFENETIGAETIWVETILVKAAEMMGHSSPRSLRPYLTYVLDRRIRLANASKKRDLEARLRQLQLHVTTLEKRRDDLIGSR